MVVGGRPLYSDTGALSDCFNSTLHQDGTQYTIVWQSESLAASSPLSESTQTVTITENVSLNGVFYTMYSQSETLSGSVAGRQDAVEYYRADKNSEELLATLKRDYYRLRQAGIDEEMFDVIAGSTI